MWIHSLIDRLFYGGYDAAKEEASIEILARFSRGNTSTQNGNIMDEAALESLSLEGDRAVNHIKHLIPAA